MQKTASKNIIPSESYEFLKIWVAIKLFYMCGILKPFKEEHMLKGYQRVRVSSTP